MVPVHVPLDRCDRGQSCQGMQNMVFPHISGMHDATDPCKRRNDVATDQSMRV